MRFGIIGFGKIARKFAASITFTEDGSVYAIASRSLSQDDEYLKEHPDVVVYRDYEELLKDEKVEAVYVALTHKYHKEWILKALERGIPVLSEKPLVLCTKDVDEIAEMAKKTQTYCLEALKTKFNTGFEQLKKDLKLIGKIRYLEANFCSDASDLPKTSFLFDVEQGGALNDIGSYVLGFLLGIHPVKIVKIESQIKTIDGIEHYFKSRLQFEDGSTAIAEGAIDRKKERTAIIEGEEGRIEIPTFNRMSEYKIMKKDGSILERKYPIQGDDMTLEIQTFIDDVKNGRAESQIHSLSDTKKILELTQRIRESL